MSSHTHHTFHEQITYVNFVKYPPLYSFPPRFVSKSCIYLCRKMSTFLYQSNNLILWRIFAYTELHIMKIPNTSYHAYILALFLIRYKYYSHTAKNIMNNSSKNFISIKIFSIHKHIINRLSKFQPYSDTVSTIPIVRHSDGDVVIRFNNAL